MSLCTFSKSKKKVEEIDYRKQALGFYFFSLLLSFLFHLQIHGQNANEKTMPLWLTVSHDNDLFSVGELTDRYYSFGFQAEFMKQYEKKTRSLIGNNTNKYFGISINFQGYTPDYLLEQVDPSKQRHFLSHTYLSISNTHSNERQYFKSQLNIGKSGNFVDAQRIQNWVHQNISGDRDVNGWSAQIERKLSMHLYSNWKMKILEQNKHSLRVGSQQSIGNLFTYIQPTVNYQYHFNKQTEYLPFKYHRNQKNNVSIEAEIGFRYEFLNASIEGEFQNKRDQIAEEDIIRNLLMAGISIRYDFKNFGVFAGNYFNTRRIKTNQHHIWGVGGISMSIN